MFPPSRINFRQTQYFSGQDPTGSIKLSASAPAIDTALIHQPEEVQVVGDSDKSKAKAPFHIFLDMNPDSETKVQLIRRVIQKFPELKDAQIREFYDYDNFSLQLNNLIRTNGALQRESGKAHIKPYILVIKNLGPDQGINVADYMGTNDLLSEASRSINKKPGFLFIEDWNSSTKGNNPNSTTPPGFKKHPKISSINLPQMEEDLEKYFIDLVKNLKLETI